MLTGNSSASFPPATDREKVEDRVSVGGLLGMEERHCFQGAVNFLPREILLPLTLPPLALGALPRRVAPKGRELRRRGRVVKRLLAPVEGVREKERVLGVEEVPNLIELSVESCTSFTILSSNILEESREEDLREFTEALDTF